MTQRVEVARFVKFGSLRNTETTVTQKMIAATTPTLSGTQNVMNFLTSMKIDTPTVARYRSEWLRIRTGPAEPTSPWNSPYPCCAKTWSSS